MNAINQVLFKLSTYYTMNPIPLYIGTLCTALLGTHYSLGVSQFNLKLDFSVILAHFLFTRVVRKVLFYFILF